MYRVTFELRDVESDCGRCRRWPDKRTGAYLVVLLSLLFLGLAGEPRGLRPEATLQMTPAAADSGFILVGAVPPARMFSVSSTTRQPMVLGKFQLSGAHPDSFWLENLTCTGRTVLGNCQLAVFYRPQQAGVHEAVLEMIGADGRPKLSSRIRGGARKVEPPTSPQKEAEPRLEISKDRRFPSTPVGDSSVLPLTLRNAGGGRLSITEARFEETGPIGLESDVTAFALEAGQGRDLTLTLRPKTPGSVRNTLVIVGERGELDRLEITGEGYRIPVADGSLDMALTQFVKPNQTGKAILTSTGDAVLIPGRPVIEGQNSEMFSVGSTDCIGKTLENTDKCAIVVRFVPPPTATAGKKIAPLFEALLVVPVNSSEGRKTLKLTGRIGNAGPGPDPMPAVAVGELKMEPQEIVGLSKVGQALLVVRGSGILRAGPAEIEGKDAGVFRVIGDGCRDRLWTEGGQCRITIQFGTLPPAFPPKKVYPPFEAVLVVPDKSNGQRATLRLVGHVSKTAPNFKAQVPGQPVVVPQKK